MWPQYYTERDFLKEYGDMSVYDYIEKHTYSFYCIGEVNPFKGSDETIRSFIESKSALYKEQVKYTVFSGRDDVEYTIIWRDYELVEVTTLPKGESRCWLEMGMMRRYQRNSGHTFEQWVKDPLRYPHKDGYRLDVNRTYFLDYTRWKIGVALDYPLEIRL